MAADRKLYLRNAWIGAHAAYGPPASGPEFEAVLGAYGEVGRHYHTAEHLYRCLVAIDEEPSFASADDIAAVRLAVFFHDIVYDVTSADNEAASEARWRSYAGRAGFPPSVRELVSALILATRSHQVDRTSPFC
jgi:predicted metal-dependent HD superfamily phosphohydrolase